MSKLMDFEFKRPMVRVRVMVWEWAPICFFRAFLSVL